MMSAYEFTVLDADCNAVDLNKYKGNVTLIVNTSRYDEKAQESYELLASIYQKYKDEDLSILLFPCAQFGAQTNARMEKEFLHNNNLSDAGTLFKEVDVNGPTTSELFKHLKAAKPGTAGGFIKRNFTIFVVNRQGGVMERITANVHPYVLDEVLVKYL